MAEILRLNTLDVNTLSESAYNQQGSEERARIITFGRRLMREHSAKATNMMGNTLTMCSETLNSQQYSAINREHQEHLLTMAAKITDSMIGRDTPDNFLDLKRNNLRYYGDSTFYKVLAGIVQDVVTPIIARTYSEAVSMFAQVVSVGFGETYTLSVGSNDIPIFQDSAWGASMSVPMNRFYNKDYALNPQPKTAEIGFKWLQLWGNNMDFGSFYNNLAAGLYSKTMAMETAMLVNASTNTSLIPSNMQVTFNDGNMITLGNRVAALNNTTISNVIIVGGYVPCSRILPTQVTGAANVNMDAAIATLLGKEYMKTGYIGEYKGMKVLPLQDAVVAGSQNTSPATLLPNNRAWLMSTNGYKPLVIAYNSDTPIMIEFDPTKTADMMIGGNLTIAIDSCAPVASKIGTVTPV